MCGLVGMAGAVGVTEEKAFKDLLIIDSLRGPHSTGLCRINNVGNLKIVKAVGDPFELIVRNDYNIALQGLNKVLIGHNRYATKGAINKVNAHPFEFDNVAGAHNGTLTTQYLLDDSKDFEVDSENLYHHMNKHGVSATTSKLGGAYTLTWWDKTDNTVNLLRNKERPLFYTYSTSKGTLFWASEKWMLEGALGRNGIKHGAIIDLPVHTQLKQKILFPVNGVTQPIPSPTFEVRPHYTPAVTSVVNTGKSVSVSPKVTSINSNGGKLKRLMGKSVEFYVLGEETSKEGLRYIDCRMLGFEKLDLRVHCFHNPDVLKLLSNTEDDFSGEIRRVVDRNGEAYGVIDLRTIKVIEYAEPDDLLELDYPGYNSERMTGATWASKTAKGCSWCSDVPVPSEKEDIIWIDDNNHVCVDCASTASVKEYLKDESY